MYRQRRHPARFHGAEPFDIETGTSEEEKNKSQLYQIFFPLSCVKLETGNRKVVAVTAAMPDGTGLKRFSEYVPGSFF